MSLQSPPGPNVRYHSVHAEPRPLVNVSLTFTKALFCHSCNIYLRFCCVKKGQSTFVKTGISDRRSGKQPLLSRYSFRAYVGDDAGACHMTLKYAFILRRRKLIFMGVHFLYEYRFDKQRTLVGTTALGGVSCSRGKFCLF